MGGLGSTRWNGHKPKPLVEESLRIDLLAPELRPALRQPGETAAFTTFTQRDQFHSQWLLLVTPTGDDGSRELVVLPADDVSEEAAQHFALKRVRVGFDERIYAVCAGCEKTTRILFALPDKAKFACKACVDLTYTSVRRHDKRVDRVAQRIRGGDMSVVDELITKGRTPGYRGFVADRLLLAGLAKAFPDA